MKLRLTLGLVGILGAIAPFGPGMPFHQPGSGQVAGGTVVGNDIVQGTLVADAGNFGVVSSINVQATNSLLAQVNMCINSLGNACVTEDGSGNLVLQPNGSAGVKFNSGTPITSVGVGSCTMSAGTTCSATTTGTTAASLCTVTPQAATSVTFFPTPGAGTTTVTASAANSVKFVVHCFN